ncbi:MAG: hypothetical protein VX589_19600 [Myxococcota bacterium]|nr:hypothetical protein [Myxococcota bacterium]
MARRLFFEPGLNQTQIAALAQIAASTGCGDVGEIGARLVETPSWFIDVTHFREAATLCEMLSTVTEVQCYLGPGSSAKTQSRRQLIGRLMRHGLNTDIVDDAPDSEDESYENSWSSSTLSEFQATAQQVLGQSSKRASRKTRSAMTAILESQPAFNVDTPVKTAEYAPPKPRFEGPATGAGRLFVGPALATRDSMIHRVLHFIEYHTGTPLETLLNRVRADESWLFDVHDERMGEALASRLTRLLRHPVVFRTTGGDVPIVPDALLDDLAEVAQHRMVSEARIRHQILDEAVTPMAAANLDPSAQAAAPGLRRFSRRPMVLGLLGACMLTIDVRWHLVHAWTLPSPMNNALLWVFIGFGAGVWLWWLGPQFYGRRLAWSGGEVPQMLTLRRRYLDAYA